MTLVVVVALTGCAGGTAPRVTVLPTPGITSTASAPASNPPAPSPTAAAPDSTAPTAPASPAAAQTVVCENDAASVSGPAGTYFLSGACARVTVAGTGIILTGDGGAIDVLLIQGDGNTVAVPSAVSDATVEGQDNAIVLQRVDTLTLRGQRNTVTSTDDIARLDIAGNGNAVDAPGVGTVGVSGDGNVYPGS